MSDYTKRMLRLTKSAQNDDALMEALIERIYSDGYEDGANSADEKTRDKTIKGLFTKDEINIIVESLLHEMQRYNNALDLVSDATARKALEDAKRKVYRVFTTVNSFTED